MLYNALTVPKIRMDGWGDGHYLANRKGGRKHNGVDLAVPVNQEIIVEFDGEVTKIGKPYAQKFDTLENKVLSEFDYVEIRDSDDFHHRYFYVTPLVRKYQKIKKGDVIGAMSAGHTRIYPGMMAHVHVEVATYKDGKIDKYHDPSRWYKWIE